MLKYCNDNNATCASETENGRSITASQTGEAQNTAAQQEPNLIFLLHSRTVHNEHFPARITAVDVKRASDSLIIFSTGLCTLTDQCNSYKISGSHDSKYQGSCFLVCNVVYCGIQLAVLL